eukprot:m.414292 g.414292  ORF g.414292 m.414292 type:complete len:61 (+) comp29306_c0_seq1:2807-2989(+)
MVYLSCVRAHCTALDDLVGGDDVGGDPEVDGRCDCCCTTYRSLMGFRNVMRVLKTASVGL